MLLHIMSLGFRHEGVYVGCIYDFFTITGLWPGVCTGAGEGGIEEDELSQCCRCNVEKEISEISGHELNRYYLFHIFNIDEDKYVIPVIRTAP